MSVSEKGGLGFINELGWDVVNELGGEWGIESVGGDTTFAFTGWSPS